MFDPCIKVLPTLLTTHLIKALTALVGQLSLSVDWENGPGRGLKTVSVNPKLPVI